MVSLHSRTVSGRYSSSLRTWIAYLAFAYSEEIPLPDVSICAISKAEFVLFQTGTSACADVTHFKILLNECVLQDSRAFPEALLGNERESPGARPPRLRSVFEQSGSPVQWEEALWQSRGTLWKSFRHPEESTGSRSSLLGLYCETPGSAVQKDGKHKPVIFSHHLN